MIFWILWLGIPTLISALIGTFFFGFSKRITDDASRAQGCGIAMAVIAFPFLLFGTCVGLVSHPFWR